MKEQGAVGERYARVAGTLDERGRRAVAASEALALPGVLRIKGRARVADKASAVVQAVGVRVEAWFDPAPAPAGLVVIGVAGFDRTAVLSRLMS